MPRQVIRLLLGFALSPRTRAMVAAFLHRFDEVRDRRITTREVDALHLDRTIRHWEPVFARARWLLAGLFPDVRTGNAAGSALLFNMEKLFEMVLGLRIRHACQATAGNRISVGLQNTMKNLATSGFQLRPDITIQNGNESVAIIDAKWKRLDLSESNSGVSSGDAYQMNAYASRYRCNRLALVYPASVDCPPGKIGDIAIAEEPQERRSRLEWPASSCLDGASGVTPISLRDAVNGDVLARSHALVEPSKLSASAYDAMFEDMRRISVELLLDLISKSRLAIAQRPSSRSGGIQPLTARLELNQIRRFWNRFSPILADILEDPHMEMRQRRSIRRPRPGERLTPGSLRRFVQRGLSAREAVRSGTLVELPTAMPDQNTQENRVIVAFMDLLWRRVDRSLKRARAERDIRLARKHSFGVDDAALARFIQLREEPKIARLQEIVDAGESIVTEIRRAMRSFAVPVTRMGRQDFLARFNSPYFRSHPHYARAAQLMHAFINNTAVVVEQGDAEGAKPIETIFEQWVFFKISAALQAAGLRCISHNSIFEPIARDRFSVDLDRNAAIDFAATDGRVVRLRYEPTVLPRQAAQGIDSIYRGHSASPWTPDIVLEILVPGNGPRDYRLAYAAVVDAKYTRKKYVWDRLQRIEKYREIRSVDSDIQIARQVWVAAPIEASIQPRDEAITWSYGGEVGADPDDVILGVVGIDPSDADGTGLTLKAFVVGILNHSEAYASSNRSTVAQKA